MILLASAKTMKPVVMNNPTKPIFSEKSEIIRNQIAQLDKLELADYFKIKGKTLDQTYEYYQNPIDGQVLSSLDGQVFKQIKLSNPQYVEQNIFILDAMYGILNGNDQIKLFRLDFNLRSLLPVSYYNFWKEDVNKFISQTSHSQILNLASNEYTKLLQPQIINKQIIEIEFDKTITSSVHKKQCRGKIANYCITHNVTDYKQLNNLLIEDYRLSFKNDDLIIISK